MPLKLHYDKGRKKKRQQVEFFVFCCSNEASNISCSLILLKEQQNK